MGRRWKSPWSYAGAQCSSGEGARDSFVSTEGRAAEKSDLPQRTQGLLDLLRLRGTREHVFHDSNGHCAVVSTWHQTIQKCLLSD